MRLQYQDEDEGLFESIKKTLIGDDDDDYDYNPRDGRNVYRNPEPDYYGGGRRDYDDVNNYPPRRSGNDYPYSGSSISRPTSNPPNNPPANQPSPRRYDDYPPRDERDRRYRVDSKRNIPYENDWDDDDWF